MRFSVKKINLSGIEPKIDHATNGALSIFSQQVFKDMTPFVPMDTGNLAESPARASNFNKGQIIYDTPYAKRMYNGVNFNFSTDKHPQAQAHWDEKAKTVHIKSWEKVAKRAIEQGL